VKRDFGCAGGEGGNDLVSQRVMDHGGHAGRVTLPGPTGETSVVTENGQESQFFDQGGVRQHDEAAVEFALLRCCRL